MLIIVLVFCLLVIIDLKTLKAANNKVKQITIYCFFMALSFIISIILNYNIKVATPAQIIESFLHMLGVIP
jgi:hypothetical protein